MNERTAQSSITWRPSGKPRAFHAICGVVVGVSLLGVSAVARAQGPSPMSPGAESPGAPPPPQVVASPQQQGNAVGGHVGAAVPLATFRQSGNTNAVDEFTLVHPIGITIKLTDRLAVDFETVMVNPIGSGGSTGLIVDPGVVYNWGLFATGLRVAWQVNATEPNIGLIPLINKGLVEFGKATWFVEAAFPTFYVAGSSDPGGPSSDLQFNVVLHTGVGF